MEDAQFTRLLDDLRARRTDHQTVEAKRARDELPGTTHETLSAFANTIGGIVVLGVEEGHDHAFTVTGLADPAKMQQDFSALCALMEPPLRPIVSLIEHEGEIVLVAEVSAVPREQRPCHRAADGPQRGSFTRVADRDDTMAEAEVNAMLAERASHEDHTARPAPERARLDLAAVEAFAIPLLREGEDTPALQRRFGVAVDDRPTIAGALTLGEAPEALLHAARVTYRIIPGAGAPAGARFAEADHIEGTVGQILDGAMQRFERDLRVFQVVGADGHVRDELEVPREALREIVSNALVHRSFITVQETRPIVIEITDLAIVVTSPGGLHVGADVERLGLIPSSGIRNLSLVRISQQLTTPGGARIVENQGSGIASADRACHRAGAMPPLFLDLPDQFQAVLFRGAIETDRAREALTAHAVGRDEELVRLAAIAFALEDAIDQLPDVPIRRFALDARLGARALAPLTQEDAAVVLRRLEDGGVLRRRSDRHIPAWTVAAPAAALPGGHDDRRGGGRRSRGDRVPDLLLAIHNSEPGRLSSSQIGEALHLTSPTSANRWIRRALEVELIERDGTGPTDPTATYGLTRGGRARAEQLAAARA